MVHHINVPNMSPSISTFREHSRVEKSWLILIGTFILLTTSGLEFCSIWMWSVLSVLTLLPNSDQPSLTVAKEFPCQFRSLLSPTTGFEIVRTFKTLDIDLHALYQISIKADALPSERWFTFKPGYNGSIEQLSRPEAIYVHLVDSDMYFEVVFKDGDTQKRRQSRDRCQIWDWFSLRQSFRGYLFDQRRERLSFVKMFSKKLHLCIKCKFTFFYISSSIHSKFWHKTILVPDFLDFRKFRCAPYFFSQRIQLESQRTSILEFSWLSWHSITCPLEIRKVTETNQDSKHCGKEKLWRKRKSLRPIRGRLKLERSDKLHFRIIVNHLSTWSKDSGCSTSRYVISLTHTTRKIEIYYYMRHTKCQDSETTMRNWSVSIKVIGIWWPAQCGIASHKWSSKPSK